MVLIQETKTEIFESKDVQKLWGNLDIEFAESGAQGASGGILTTWKSEAFKPRTITVHRNFIVIIGFLWNFECAIGNVYAPNEATNRMEVWDELLQLKNGSQIPLYLGGDFNEIKAMCERTGCTRMAKCMRIFKDFINQAELKDLPMMGKQFTWTNFQNNAIHNRIDRFLISPEFLEKFSVVLWGLPRPISDHSPIMITDNNWNWGPKPFRFMDAWLSHPKCLKIAKEVWETTPTYGWAGCQIVKKLKEVKRRLKVWNKQEFGNMFTKQKGLQDQIHQLDILSESRQLSANEREQRSDLRVELWKCSRLVECI